MEHFPEKAFSKLDTFVIMNMPSELHGISEQAWCGMVSLKNTFYGVQFVAQWLAYAQDARVITDALSVFGPEDSDFIDHRHDQSICSLLSKKWEITLQELRNEDIGTFVAHYENFVVVLPNGQRWRHSRSHPEQPDIILKFCEENGINMKDCLDHIEAYIKQLGQGFTIDDMLSVSL
jgi:hypothetical protein